LYTNPEATIPIGYLRKVKKNPTIFAIKSYKKSKNCEINYANPCLQYLYLIEVSSLLLFQMLFYFFVGHHLLIKYIRSGLGAFHHLDDLRIRATVFITLVKSCNNFLCHFLSIYLISL